MENKYDENISDDFAKLKRWTPEIVKVNSVTGDNFNNLLDVIKRHKEFMEKTDLIKNYLRTRIKNETFQILYHKLKKKFDDLMNSNQEQIDKLINNVIEKSLNPYTMADLLIKMLGIE
jgi:putative protein kinase ArgK-like GTPase of G3E family